MASVVYQKINCPAKAIIFGKYFFVTGPQTVYKQCLYLSTSCSSMIKWRYEQDIEPNPNRFGILRHLPDYSYVDGRPVPLSLSALRKLKLQESYCQRIMQLSNELDFAVERHKRMVEESKENTRKLIQSKLKEKGPAFPLEKKQKS